ncbi:NUDIX hydrolase [Candidatus Acetothermia bacterium]|nr:NUDIX hydrolase [Candidatus Acetothermia bacterium]
MHDYPYHIVAVMGVVTNSEGRILLVKTERRGWEPLGGQVEAGENLIEALQREILEESGCTVTVDKLVGVYSNPAPPPKLIFAFSCSHAAGEPQPSHETSDAGWFTPEEALQMVVHQPQHVRLRDVLSHNESIIYRSYTTNPYQVLYEKRF